MLVGPRPSCSSATSSQQQLLINRLGSCSPELSAVAWPSSTTCSVVCLSAAGRYSDSLKLLNHWMTSGNPTADLYVLRARLHRRLQQTLRCYQDVKAALALNPSCPAAGLLLQQLHEASEASRLKAVDKTLTGQLPQALCMINVALENNPQDPRLHLFR
uniref:Uncharacterized protein n=1 Tax=Amphiprion percula TaxID=161767 RepID=A0A3P8TYT0_AMPPE